MQRWSLAIAVFLCMATAQAAERSIEELWQIVERQQAQIESLTVALEATRTKLDTTGQQARITEERLSVTADYIENVSAGASDKRLSIGGYGEMHYNNVDASDNSGDFKELDLHRFVTFMNYDFTDRIRFFSELEVEHSLVKDTDDGSSGGEVEVEQAYIEYDISENHFARTGLFLLPVGILNETHEPPTFYGVERNNVENVIIPSTWWEGGASVGGHYANGISWDFAVHSGLDMPTQGSSAYRVRSGRQKVSHAVAEDLAYTGRVKYTGLAGLELAATVQYQEDVTQLSNDGLDEGLLVSLHGVFNRGPFALRALWAQWDFDGAGIEAAGVDEQTGWYIEPSFELHLLGFDWGFYTRYEDVEGGRNRDQFDQWELGFNFYPTDNVVLKFDYRDREHNLDSEAGRDFNAIDLGVGYQF